MTSIYSQEFIRAAIIGFQNERSRIDAQIADLRARLNGSSVSSQPPPAGNGAQPADSHPKRRGFSAAARKRMSQAQRLRWKKIRANQ